MYTNGYNLQRILRPNFGFSRHLQTSFGAGKGALAWAWYGSSLAASQEQVFGSSVDTQNYDNLWRSTKINHSNFPIPSLSLERSCRMPPTDQPSFKPFTNKIREVELTRVASSKPQRSTRLFGCGRTAKRFMQCSWFLGSFPLEESIIIIIVIVIIIIIVKNIQWRYIYI